MSYNKVSVFRRINNAVKQDRLNNPTWPDHAVAQAGKVTAASGKLTQAALDYKYNKTEIPEECVDRMQEAAINTIVQAFRFLENLNKSEKKVKSGNN